MVSTTISGAAVCGAMVYDEVLGHEFLPIMLFAVAILAFSLGALNTAISRHGEVVMPLSYMTGTVVKTAQGLAQHLSGRDPWRWVAQLVTWLAFVSGVAVGALTYRIFDADGSLVAIAIIAVLVVIVAFVVDREQDVALN